ETTADAMKQAFMSVFIATLTADDDDNNLTNGTPHASQIINAFQLHNIGITNLVSVIPSQIPLQDSSATEYPLTAAVTYSGEVGSIDTGSVKVFYSVDNGKHYDSTSLHSTGGTTYRGAIPKIPAGTL